MRLFRSAQKTAALLGLAADRRPFNGQILTILLVFVMIVSFYYVYLFRVANTFKEYTDNIYLTSSTTTITISFIVFSSKMEKIFRLINQLEGILEKRLIYARSTAIYLKTDKLVEQISEISYVVIAKVTPIIWVCPKCIACVYFYITTDLGDDAFELPLPMWLPIDWKNPIAYLIAVIFQLVTTAYTFVFICAALSLGVGGFLFALSITNDIRGILNSINKNAKSNENGRETLEQLYDYIQLHAASKQLVERFLDIYRLIFLTIFLWSLICISGTLLMLQIEMSNSHLDPVILFVTIFYASYAFGMLFVCCELGQQMTDAFEKIDETIDQFDWHLHQSEVTRLLPIVMAIAQQPVEISCFGSIACSRFSFKKVLNSAFSYFTVLRKFD